MQVLSKIIVAAVVAVLVVVAPVTPAAAQPVPISNPAQDEAGPPPQSIKVTVVIARYQGETRTSNLPYTLWVNANDDSSTNLRMSASVPIPSGVVYQREGVTPAPAQITYQPLGTNIDCRVLTVGSDAFRVNLTVNDSSVAESPAPADGAFSMPPRILNFTSTNSVILRDGQSVEYITAADKATGEVVKLTLSIEVVR